VQADLRAKDREIVSMARRESELRLEVVRLRGSVRAAESVRHSSVMSPAERGIERDRTLRESEGGGLRVGSPLAEMETLNERERERERTVTPEASLSLSPSAQTWPSPSQPMAASPYVPPSFIPSTTTTPSLPPAVARERLVDSYLAQQDLGEDEEGEYIRQMESMGRDRLGDPIGREDFTTFKPA
ncbi:hypothetical protein KIPB_014311, partial [Kipferlia bialata]